MKNTSAQTMTGEIRKKVPSKQMSSTQRSVVSSVPMQTNKGRDMEYKACLKKQQKDYE